MAKILVKMDVGDLVDRLFVPPDLDRHIGLSNLFQEAVKLTVLDKRRFSPPIESGEDRVQNLRNTMETFGISRRLVDRVISAGFRSTALMALADTDSLSRDAEMTRSDYVNLMTMLKMINCSPLEPLYSLNRLAHHNRRTKTCRGGLERFEHLDLATSPGAGPPSKAQINKFYRMATKGTFATTNDGVFGRQVGSRGLEHHVEVPATVVFIPYDLRSQDVPHPSIVCPRRRQRGLDFDSEDSSGSGSSNSLNGEVQDHNHNQPMGKRLRKGGRWSCPFLNCQEWFNDLHQHLFMAHNGYVIDAKAKAFVSDGSSVVHRYRSEQLTRLGHVDLAVESVIMSSQYVWWGPKCFDCQGIKFFLALFKWTVHGPPPDRTLVFSVVANVEEETARMYYTNVEIQDPSPKQRTLRKGFRGRVLSLSKPQPTGENPDLPYHKFSDLTNYIFPDGKIRFRLGIYKSRSRFWP